MIASTIPNDGNPTVRIVRLQGLEEGHRRLRIPFVISLAEFLGGQVKGTIIGLPLAFIRHRDLNPLTPLAPGIAA